MPRDARDAVKQPIPHPEIGRSRKGLIQAQERLQKGSDRGDRRFWVHQYGLLYERILSDRDDMPALHTPCGRNGLYSIHFPSEIKASTVPRERLTTPRDGAGRREVLGGSPVYSRGKCCGNRRER